MTPLLLATALALAGQSNAHEKPTATAESASAAGIIGVLVGGAVGAVAGAAVAVAAGVATGARPSACAFSGCDELADPVVFLSAGAVAIPVGAFFGAAAGALVAAQITGEDGEDDAGDDASVM